MKRIICVLYAVLLCVLCVLPTTTAFASNSQISPQSDTMHYYVNRNKRLDTTRGTNGTTVDVDYYFREWAYCSSHYVENGFSFSIEAEVLQLASALTKTSLFSGGGLTATYTYDQRGGHTFDADQSRCSNVGIFKVYKNYIVDTYYVIDFGYTRNEHYQGESIVKEPSYVYLDVVYRT